MLGLGSVVLAGAVMVPLAPHLPSLTPPPFSPIRTPEFPGGPCFRSLALCEGWPSASALRPQVSYVGLRNTPPPPPVGAELSKGCADVDAVLRGVVCKVWGPRPAV